MTRSPSTPRPSTPSSGPQPGPPVLRLGKPEEVFAAVPYLLGFHPQQSLVVLGLRGPRGRLGVSMRMDLDGPPDELADVVLRGLTSDGDTSVIFVLYDPLEDPTGKRPAGTAALPTDELVDTIRRRCEQASIQIRDVLCVAGGRWWSALCRDLACCPPEGKPVAGPDGASGSSVVDATAVSAGLTALPDRQALRATLEPPVPWLHAATEQAMERVGGDLVTRLAAGEQTEVEDELIALIDGFVDRFGGRTPALSDDEVAQVALGLHLLEVRDTVITWTLGDDAEALQRMLVETVRRTAAPSHVPAASVLAWCAYSRGNGGLAGVALELVTESEPDYSLARLVDHSLQHGIHPDLLRTATRQTAQELAERNRGRDTGPGRRRSRSTPSMPVPEDPAFGERAG
jgi:hypothetical protein